MTIAVVVLAALLPILSTTQVSTGVVTGQLLSREGQPSVGVRISAMAVPEPYSPSTNATSLMSFALTDSAGRYRLENIPPGRYYIIAGLLESPTYYPGVSLQSAATVVSVASGATVSNINFSAVAPGGVSVSGRVIRPSNQAVPATTRVALLGGSPLQETTANADGSFQFARVRPGTYTLMVTNGTMAQPLSVVVADKDVTGIEAVLIPTVQFTGNIVVEENGLTPRMTLTFSSFKGGVSPPVAVVLQNGTIQGTLAEGEYRVGWSNLPAGYYLKSIASGSTDLLTNSFRITAGTIPPPLKVTLGVATPPPWVKVSGRVKGITSTTTLPRIALNNPTVLDLLEAPVSADGSFEFPRVLPGTYTARFVPPLPVVVQPILVSTRDVANLEIVLPALKEVPGRVLVEGIGTIAPRLSFSWTDPSTSQLTSANAIAQPDGTFRVTLPQGERRVTLNAPGYIVRSLSYGTADLLRDPLKLAAADTQEFRVTLAASTTSGGAVFPGLPAMPTGVVGGVVGGVTGGVVGGVLGGILAPLNAPSPPAAAQADPPTRIGGDVAQANLISSVTPRYPEAARAAGVQGVVRLQAVISKDGAVEDLKVISGHTLLNDAAIDAVKQWRFKPAPTRVITTLTVNFSLQ